MADIMLDLNPISPTLNDLLIRDGDLVITPDTLSAVRQHILQRLRIFLGEWFLNNQVGLPFFQQILIKNPDQSKIDALLRNQIQGTPGVEALNSYSFSPDFTLRVLTVSFSARCTGGTVDYEGLITF